MHTIICKGATNMSKDKKSEQFSFFSPLPFKPSLELPELNKDDICDKMDEYDDALISIWNQFIDLQKANLKTAKTQWLQTYDYIMKMQDTFTASLPEKVPVPSGLPEFPATTKNIVDDLKKFQKMSKEHIVEQADSVTDFCIKGQEQTREVGKKVADKASDARREFAKKNDEAKASNAEPAKRKTTRSRAKSAPAKEDAPADESA